MIVYVVTEGSYSDYHIEAVFTDRDQANNYLMLHPLCEIEEYEADAIKVDVKKIRYEWKVRISPDGKLLSLCCTRTLEPKDDEIIFTDDGWYGIHFVVRLTTDRELDKSMIEKVCFDRIAKFKAEQLGL